MAQTVQEKENRLDGADDPRRQLPIRVEWQKRRERVFEDGRILIDGVLWACVEWSEKQQCWCIEDAEGCCLRHQEDERGRAASRHAAVALAREMIRDGRMPSPEQARETRTARRKAVWNKPANVRVRQKRRDKEAEVLALKQAQRVAEQQNNSQPLLVEALAEAFDFNDLNLWKSNSWAMLRPRLIIHQRAVVAKLAHELAETINQAGKEPFSWSRDKEERRAARARRRQWGEKECCRIRQRLDRAREILRALEET